MLASSIYEHDEFFWLSFLEALRILKPGGFLYLSLPSNGYFHQYPNDYWRFYPDAGIALAKWGQRNDFDVTLLESFVGRRKGDIWNDFVAIFEKGSHYQGPLLSEDMSCYNLYKRANNYVLEFPQSETEDMEIMANSVSKIFRGWRIKKYIPVKLKVLIKRILFKY